MFFFCLQTVAGVLSLRVQQLDVRCETKTKVRHVANQLSSETSLIHN